jgi:hypothetical protein
VIGVVALSKYHSLQQSARLESAYERIRQFVNRTECRTKDEVRRARQDVAMFEIGKTDESKMIVIGKAKTILRSYESVC